MARENLLRKSLHRRRSSRVKGEDADELNYKEIVLDDSMSIEALKHDKKFWRLIVTNQEFRQTMIESIISCNEGEHIGQFFIAINYSVT